MKIRYIIDVLISIIIILSICCFGFATEQINEPNEEFQKGVDDVICNLEIENIIDNLVYIKYNDITYVYLYENNIDNNENNPKINLTPIKMSATMITVEKTKEETKEEVKENNVPANSGAWKCFEYWTSLTSKSSKQYKLQKYAYTDSEGFRRIDNYYMIATGSAYGNVGDILEVTLSSGTIFQAIKGDAKADRDTDKNNQICIHDGSVIEFIVDKTKLNKTAKKLGDCSRCGFEGYVENIEVIGSYECKD